MLWFNQNKEEDKTLREQEIEEVIQLHKETTDNAIAKTQKVTDNFNRVIKENGFTLKIHVAAGGKH